MIDLSKVQNYYVACGYTDLRRGIDGLASIIIQQYGGQLDEESLFLRAPDRPDQGALLVGRWIYSAIQASVEWTVSVAKE